MSELTIQLNEPTVLFTSTILLEKKKKRGNTILKMFIHCVGGIIIGVLIGILIYKLK